MRDLVKSMRNIPSLQVRSWVFSFCSQLCALLTVTLNKSLNLSKTQFMCLRNGLKKRRSTSLSEVLRELIKVEVP